MEAVPVHPEIQCSTGPLWALELERALDAIADAGFADVELMVTRDPQTQEPDVPGELAAARGLRIASVHGPFLAVTKGVWGPDPLDKMRRGVAMCRALGADRLIVHPPYLWESSFARWIQDDSEEAARVTGVTVAVETMFPRWLAGRRLRVHHWIELHRLLRSAHRVVLDTSHLTVAREDVLAAYSLLRPKLAHIHLSDNAGDGRDGHLELGAGVVPVAALLAELRRTQYSGAVSLELSVRRYLEDYERLVGTLSRNRVFVETLLAGSSSLEKGLPGT